MCVWYDETGSQDITESAIEFVVSGKFKRFTHYEISSCSLAICWVYHANLGSNSIAQFAGGYKDFISQRTERQEKNSMTCVLH